MKRSPLRRRKPLRARPKRQPAHTDPNRMVWKTPRAGKCACCDTLCLHLHRHHVVPLEVIKREDRLDLAWDLRNALLLCERCHTRHHSAFRRLPLACLPPSAFEFARELLGEDRALLFMARSYRATGLKETA